MTAPSRSTVMGIFALDLEDSERGLTVHQVTRHLARWESQVDGRQVRQVLDELAASGRLEYLEGHGNNRRYRWLRPTSTTTAHCPLPTGTPQ